ncbi:MAG: hypothetical protein WCF07_15170 [Nitrososphaeraceae archaeon]
MIIVIIYLEVASYAAPDQLICDLLIYSSLKDGPGELGQNNNIG